MIDTDKYEPTRIDTLLHNTRAHRTNGWRELSKSLIELSDDDRLLIEYAPTLRAEVERLREENHILRMADWEYERVWDWLMENADYTCKKLLILIEEWKEEDGLITIDGMTYKKELIE